MKDEKEYITSTSNKMDKSHWYNVEWKNTDTKD